MAARVLVVEDEPHIRDLVALHLRLEGLIPVTVGDGAAALHHSSFTRSLYAI
ncbi:MAG: hypothetical protein LC753_01200 [Acidobacteria bacterium]|nr:hypothetical protein [Acidobacteriota bacterium]MCA1648928.1 hypothetical protein [Acidobacteriota bacterium]